MAGRLHGKIALISGGAGDVGSQPPSFSLGRRSGRDCRSPAEPGRSRRRPPPRRGLQGGFRLGRCVGRTSVTQAVERVSGRTRTDHVLFNHAGTIVIRPFLETTVEDWDRLMAVNVRSMFLMTRAVLPQMIDAGGGSIVCTSSISAVAATPMEVLYSTTKGACLICSPGPSPWSSGTGISGAMRFAPASSRRLTARGGRGADPVRVDVSDAAIAAQQGRMCRPDEVAKAALYLASDDASFVSGAHLFVDNCFTAM